MVFICSIHLRIPTLSSVVTRDTLESPISSTIGFRVNMLETATFPTPPRRRNVMFFNHLDELILRRLRRRRPPHRLFHNNGLPPARAPPRRWRVVGMVRLVRTTDLFHYMFTFGHRGCDDRPRPWSARG